MRLAIETIAYHEERFIPKFIQYYQDKVDEIAVLVSTKPWMGEPEDDDHTAVIADSLGVSVIEYAWPDETAQRNAGLEYLSGYDWIIVLDPDEYIADRDWKVLVDLLAKNEAAAYVVEHQRVFYKNKEVYPHTDYQQLIAIKPGVRFVDKRVIGSPYGVAPIELCHFSWSRTNEEIWRKITHYSHANQFNTKKWYNEVWLSDRDYDLHPNTPETLKALIEPVLPPEIEALELWP